MSEHTVGVGVIGLGFMGGTHVQAYRAANAAGSSNRLVAVCDADAERRAGRGAGGNIATGSGDRLFDPSDVQATSDPDELLANPAVELVSICTPTDSHVDLALRALDAGKHVLVEKPVALESATVERLARRAREAETVCMPAHCIRLWPAWRWAADQVRAGTFGAARSAVFRRHGSMPGWSQGFYEDAARSGGALVDLHIHDADFVLACFGAPNAVTSAGDLHHVTTLYHYDEGPVHVVAEGGWDHADGWPFRMSFTIVCEDGTIDYEFPRAPELRLVRNGSVDAIDVGATTGYDEEVRAILKTIASGERTSAVTIDDALAVARLLEAERASLASGARTAL